jgi:hypothetical protein
MKRGGQAFLSQHLAFAAILAFGMLAITARPAVDPDVWWHLRTGQWIVETGQVPHSDPFSFTRTDAGWVAHEWLSEVVFFELWKRGGFATLIVFSSIITTAGFMLLYFRCKTERRWAAAASVLGALAAAPSWGVRPQMFTFTLASLLIWLVDAGQKRPKLLFVIPPLFLLWVNLHAGFAIGLAFLLAYSLGLVWETAVGDTPWQENRKPALRMAALFLVSLAIVPANPSGAQLYRYPFTTLRSAGMRAFISEWFSPDFHQWHYFPVLLIWFLVVIAFAYLYPRPKGRIVVPLLLTALASLDAARHIPIFVLLAIPVIAGLADDWASRARAATRHAWERSRLTFNLALVLLMAGFAISKWTMVARDQAAQESELFPSAALVSLPPSPDSKRIFAYYDWGGYAIWRLYPEYQVFVDGRADLYGDKVLGQFETAISVHNGWREILDYWKVNTVLLPTNCALAQALLIDQDWRPSFNDSKAIVLVRSLPERQSASERPTAPVRSGRSHPLPHIQAPGIDNLDNPLPRTAKK